MKRFQDFLPIPRYLGNYPPSPFFTTREREDYPLLKKSSNQKFVRETRRVEEEEEKDPENYYNDWIMSNLG